MPWKECSVTEERLRFVAPLPDGEGMNEVCCDFGVRLRDVLSPMSPGRNDA